jgi:hypothetical protein
MLKTTRINQYVRQRGDNKRSRSQHKIRSEKKSKNKGEMESISVDDQKQAWRSKYRLIIKKMELKIECNTETAIRQRESKSDLN